MEQLPILDPEKIPTDEKTPNEIKDICREVSARNLGTLRELFSYATKNEDAERKYPEYTRNGHYDVNPYAADGRRILFSNEFERLGRKTQVCSYPVNAHITTRMVHPLRVSSIARALARALGVNEEFTEANALGHDIGHTFLGHLGEDIITKGIINYSLKQFGDLRLFKLLGIFKHNIQSVHVTDRIAKRRGVKHEGLNLTNQVRHGIATHDGEVDRWDVAPDPVEDLDASLDDYFQRIISASANLEWQEGDTVDSFLNKVKAAIKKVTLYPATIEACIVYLADCLHYCPEDFEDLISLEVINRNHLPHRIVQTLGDNSADMINNLVTDMIIHSYGENRIRYSERVTDVMQFFKSDFLRPYYIEVNSWVKNDTRDPRIRKPDVGGFDLQRRMDHLFEKYVEALQRPDKHKECSIIKSYLVGRDKNEYYQKLEYLDEAARMYQLVVDYIAGFTDDFFLSESNDLYR